MASAPEAASVTLAVPSFSRTAARSPRTSVSSSTTRTWKTSGMVARFYHFR